MKNSLLTIIIIIAAVSLAGARQLTTKATGNFTASSTWSNSNTPAAGDTLTISSSHTVTVTSIVTYTGSAMRIIVKGILEFSGGGAKLRMPSGSAVDIRTGGQLKGAGSGGGSSQQIKAGSTVLWNKSDGNVSGPIILDENNPLPITLLGFNAVQNENTVVLTWTTTNEINNDHFTIEKSTNGGNFIKLTEIAAALNSTGINEYSFTDREINGSNCIYRLSQTDYNGTPVYLSTLNMTVKSAAVNFNIWPNPATDGIINITIPATNALSYRVELFTLSGASVYQATLAAGQNSITVTDVLTGGIYIARVSDSNGKTSNTKLVIQ